MGHTFYVTTPIYYVNDIPHIGHAYTTIAADVLARYHRLTGSKVFFLTGIDEHGQKVQEAARERNISPQEHCDEMVVRFQDLWKKFNISNDDFIRTTEERHQIVVQKILTHLFKKGDIPMPTHKVKGGWQWGNHGKVYKTKAEADAQGRAAYASGYKGKKKKKSKKRKKR